ncbi:hypothetical protein [Zhihengliuella flava]|uniref:Uncharacterized protein n=1 Tax=Zhihengliuella flava TaxID=1285193 RepID=A0A931DEA5_9MICC|nr:hypothetical protein [Zhihengliuella flava]MBG6085886.1 hypothetical protein [Zhihengliuella flava]
MARAGEVISLAGFDFLRPGMVGVVSTIGKNGLKGWWETPDKRGDDTARVMQDGDFPAPRTFGPRMITISGDVSCTSRDALFEFRDRLAGLPHLGSGELSVTGHGVSQTATVEQVGGLKWSERNPRAASWSMDLKAPDPRKYGELRVTAWTTASRTSPVSVQVSHEGNYPAAPVIEVKGSMTSGFTAWGTGEDSYRSLETVNAGELFEVDFGSGLLRKDGAVVFGQTGYTNLAKVMPGVSRAANVIPATDGGVGQYRVLVRDTYI